MVWRGLFLEGCSPWLVEGPRPAVSSLGLSFVCVSLEGELPAVSSLSYQDTNPGGLEPYLYDLISLNFYKDPISQYSYTGGQGFNI